jgi:pimeloyl-ACP methyl ester carboxylesterase
VRVSNALLPVIGVLLAAFCLLRDASAAPAAVSSKPPKSAKSEKSAKPAKQTAPAKRPGGLTFEPYQIKMIDGTTRDAELGRFYVPESRDRDTTHLIHLAFLRWKSTATKPGAPIVYLAGGPGIPGTSLARVPAYARLFEKLRALGDVIVPDQRGTGLSEPSLACAPSPLEPTMFESETAMRQAILKQAERCAAPLRADGIALEAFDTMESASDVEDIRRALGAERLRLVASSYGSELALETIRLYGSRIQRAALAGVRSPDKALKLPGVLDLQLRRISGLVAKDSSYAPNPTVEVLARALIGELDKRPISLSSAPASGGAQQPMKVAGAGLAAVLQGDLTDPRTVIAVPAMLNAMAAGDFRFFLGRLQVLYNTMATGMSIMSVSANCASGANPERITQVDREAAASPFGNVRNLYMDPVLCGAVGAHDLGSRYRARIYSLVPTLFLSGSLDATTPSFEAEEVAWGFPNGVHLVIENGFHDTLPEEDVQQLVVDYLGGTDVKGRRVTAPPPKFLSLDEARKLFEEQTQRPR